MSHGALLRHSFPLLVGFGLGTAAYLQAWGLSRVVAASIAEPARTAAARVAESPTPPRRDDRDHATTASAILSRNPFDSITGPLDGILRDPLPVGEGSGEAPTCDGARVVLIAASSAGRWSFAAILGPDGMPVLRREGDEIGGRSVIAIGWDRVWLARDGVRCQIGLGQPGTPASAADRKAAKGARVGPTTPAEIALAAEIRSHIHKTGEHEVEIDRTTLGEIVAHYPELVRRVRLAPEKDGVRLFGIHPGSVLEALGLANGDRLETINGFDVRDPREAIEAYARLQSASEISLAITRAGKKQTLDVHIR